MAKEWLKIVVAGLFEVGWVVGLTHSTTWWQWGLTAIAVYISFYYLIMAGEKLPVGTSYAVFVGIGTVGTVLMENVVFGGEWSFLQALFVTTLLASIVGLKRVSGEG
ncbi:DMT family transporter [Savagea faecisuis]|uniref:DMT family transporter n=1 Tax=Savagea faecisuis TaxID=1274803 RepID=A0ABW3GWU8_9BACL